MSGHIERVLAAIQDGAVTVPNLIIQCPVALPASILARIPILDFSEFADKQNRRHVVKRSKSTGKPEQRSRRGPSTCLARVARNEASNRRVQEYGSDPKYFQRIQERATASGAFVQAALGSQPMRCENPRVGKGVSGAARKRRRRIDASAPGPRREAVRRR
ncbi:hypothetical protein KM043_013521 [Ampulex compressa]|nr:hypothetical protein KM043_013521 [Ampulex compressa]